MTDAFIKTWVVGKNKYIWNLRNRIVDELMSLVLANFAQYRHAVDIANTNDARYEQDYLDYYDY